MKYTNANGILPQELLTEIQKYYQGGYLYIPKEKDCRVRRQTDYTHELEKRNQSIFLKRLEGRTVSQLGNIYHLSEPSIRRITSKQRERHQKMRELIHLLLPLWGIEQENLLQIYPSAWEVNHAYVLKVYNDKSQIERNIRILTILSECKIPVAEIVPAKTGQKYLEYQELYFLMSRKLQGSNISDIKDEKIARKMGRAIAQLHSAFLKCEKEMEFWDNNLLDEMQGWIKENLIKDNWQIIGKTEYLKTMEQLKQVYDYLPKQLVHRDVHYGNFLFFKGNLSGYIDFDLSQKNIRIFDICYFLAGLLAEETENPLTKNEWLKNIRAVITGYESLTVLSEKEKAAIPCVMKCIEILFAAYFIGIKDIKHANDAYHIFCYIQNCERDIINII